MRSAIIIATIAASMSARPAPVSAQKAACGDPLTAQVLLDKRGFSPGEIDGRWGPNASRAMAAFQQSANLPSTGQPDCETLSALGGDAAEITTEHTIEPVDIKGPFEPHIPPQLPDQAKLTALAYRTPLERLAERFHASPALLTRLNPGITIKEGQAIKVPAVTPFDVGVKPAADASAADVRIEVSREDSALRVMKADGTLMFFAPVTIGSEHDPLPLGDWKVNAVSWLPTFHYNPDLFWDANPQHSKATIKPGPNNPVGVVWIDINVEHYGIHGTPEPSKVGHTASHGCVRLTNWDAARVAGLVRAGTPVIFK